MRAPVDMAELRQRCRDKLCARPIWPGAILERAVFDNAAMAHKLQIAILVASKATAKGMT